MRMKRIALFASGSGTNAENIINYALKTSSFEVSKVYCNRPNAGIITRIYPLNIPLVVFNKAVFYESDVILRDLQHDNIYVIVLAGFLWLVPDNLIRAFAHNIINIHPALLPNYGGHGMYGAKVHEAVIKNRDTKSGISIHLVNNEYDKGEILFQAECAVNQDDTTDSLAKKVHELEYIHFPMVIDEFLNKR